MSIRCLSRRNAGIVLFMFIFVLGMASTGAQCSRSDDVLLAPSTRLESGEFAVGSCWQACAQEANDRRAAERERFVEALENCEAGTDCRAREAALHVSILREIQADNRVCMASCHNQGGGSGGQ